MQEQCMQCESIARSTRAWRAATRCTARSGRKPMKLTISVTSTPDLTITYTNSCLASLRFSSENYGFEADLCQSKLQPSRYAQPCVQQSIVASSLLLYFMLFEEIFSTDFIFWWHKTNLKEVVMAWLAFSADGSGM